MEFFWDFFWEFCWNSLAFWRDFFKNPLGILWKYEKNLFICQDFGFCQGFISMEKEGVVEEPEI